MQRKKEVILILLGLCLFLTAAGCKKKAPPPPPPPPPPAVEPKEPPPPPKLPTVKLTVEPSSIDAGQSATLSWTSSDVISIAIMNPKVENVQPNGKMTVSPAATTRYEILANGAGGQARDSATLTVRPAPPPPPAPKPATTFSEELGRRVQDVYFDYDKSDVRDDARSVLSTGADALKVMFREFPTARVTIEGHCDERGSAEYNLGLADRRATAVKEFLVQLGVDAARLNVISYGKERPQCTESNEACWQRNRRAHFAPAN